MARRALSRVLLSGLMIGLASACGAAPEGAIEGDTTTINAEATGTVEEPSTYQNLGRLPKNATICFVYNAVTADPALTTAIQNTINQWAQASGGGFTPQWRGNCSASTTPTAPADNFPENVRILIDSVHHVAPKSAVAGRGCPKMEPDSYRSFAQYAVFPEEDDHRCMWNMHISEEPGPNADNGFDPGRPFTNNWLHEFGHSLGFRHEHWRDDHDTNCLAGEPAVGIGSGAEISAVQDRRSVMNYTTGSFDASGRWVRAPACSDIVGNYGHSGLSDGDIFAMQILYPPNYLADFTGNTVTWAGSSVPLATVWGQSGINISSMMKNVRWYLDGTQVSTAAAPTLTNVTAGRHTVRLIYQDYWNATYDESVTLDVVADKSTYLGRTAAVAAGAAPVWF